MTDEEILALFAPLYNSIHNLVDTQNRPTHLAHYTSLEVIEKILIHNELWFSNPLFMNDLQEMRFGMLEGRKIFDSPVFQQELLNACGSLERATIICDTFHGLFQGFDTKHALDVYVFCLSEHKPENSDGLLSMWRGYGANGNGAALIFRTDFITFKVGSPLLIAKVRYASESDRSEWIKTAFNGSVALLKERSLPNDKLHIVAHHMFNLIEVFALLSKHHGFSEEEEWRVIYLPERDTNKLLTSQFSYIIREDGIEPKLKFKIEPLKIEPVENWTFHSILEQIILGPTLSSPLTFSAFCRMLDTLGKPEFKEKLCRSGIPFRYIKR